MSFFDDAISTLGRGLAQTAVQAATDATGFDVGGTLNALFGNGQETGGQNLNNLSSELNNSNLPTEAISALETGLSQQAAQITALGDQLTTLSSEIANIKGEIANIEAKLDKINQEILYIEWQAVNTPIINLITTIKTSYMEYANILSLGIDAKTPTSDVTNLTTQILDPDGGAVTCSAAISAYINDDGQAKGVLQLWSNMVCALINAGLLDYRDAAEQYFQYYQKLVYAQLQATNLVMEAHNFHGDYNLAKIAWNDYRSQLISQEKEFIQWLSPIIASQIQGSKVSGSGYFAGAISAAFQMNPSILMLPPNGPWTTAPTPYYEASSLYQRAEEILANLYLTQDDDRRIVAHMLYDGTPIIAQTVEGVRITIEPTSSSGGDELHATRTDRMQKYIIQNGHMGETTIDMNYYSNTFYLARFVFEKGAGGSAIQDASYCLTDLNGTHGLIPLETYLCSLHGGKANFCNPGPLAYSLPINSTSPFGFVNFLAYSMIAGLD